MLLALISLNQGRIFFPTAIYPDLLDELNQEGSEPPLPTARKSLVTDGWIDEQDVEALEEGLSERRVIQSGPSFVQSFRPRSGVNGGKYLSVEEDGPASPSSSRMHSSSSGMNSAKAVDAALWNWIKDSRPYVLACDAWEMRWPVVLGLALTFLAVLLSS